MTKSPFRMRKCVFILLGCMCSVSMTEYFTIRWYFDPGTFAARRFYSVFCYSIDQSISKFT